MGFQVGDKVKVTKAFLSNLSKLPQLASRVDGGGVIIGTYADEARVTFYSGCTYHIFYNNLELKFMKNQQLLFDFME